MSDTPQLPAQDEELSSDELDNVAGGAFAVASDPTINTNCGGNCGCGAAE